MPNKRKRDDSSDPESDEIAPGRQILPVANLPGDFNQEPKDGMQYLFLVRRDARRLPHVTRVRNPFEVSETNVAPTPTPLAADVLPCEKWRIAFQTHFSNLRRNLAQPTIRVDYTHPSQMVIPEKKDREAWWKFLAGHPESAWSPRNRSARKKPAAPRCMRAYPDTDEMAHPECVTDPDMESRHEPCHLPTAFLSNTPQNVPEQPCSIDIHQTAESTNPTPLAVEPSKRNEDKAPLSPPEITPSYLRGIDHRMSIHLLMYFTHWMNVYIQNPSDPLTTMSVGHGQWMFALLTKVEDQLSADEMNRLRNLARACLGLIQRYKSEGTKNSVTVKGISGSAVPANTTSMSEVSCWMIFAAIAGHWGQRDLWADAEATLATV